VLITTYDDLIRDYEVRNAALPVPDPPSMPPCAGPRSRHRLPLPLPWPASPCVPACL